MINSMELGNWMDGWMVRWMVGWMARCLLDEWLEMGEYFYIVKCEWLDGLLWVDI